MGEIINLFNTKQTEDLDGEREINLRKVGRNLEEICDDLENINRDLSKTDEIPKTRIEYLKKCKAVLTEEDYEDCLEGIVDSEYYFKLEDDLQKIVDTWYEIPC